jgi:hypothetical protein
MTFIAPRGSGETFWGKFYSEEHSLGDLSERRLFAVMRQLLALTDKRSSSGLTVDTASHMITMIAAPLICLLIGSVDQT